MSTLDELLNRIDADLALPAFPPLQAAVLPDRDPLLVLAEQKFRELTINGEGPLAGKLQLDKPRPRPRLPWWRRWPRRG